MEPAPSARAELQPPLLANASDALPGAFPSAGANASGPPGARSASSLALAVAITALYSAVCAVGLLGNVLVMFGIVRYTKMKTATNIYIFNLALADALATSTLPFQSAKYLMETWPFGELLCKAVLSIDYYNMFTSIFTLTMMSVDRYIAVCHPVKALDFRTPAKAKLINICIWVLASGVGVPIMVMAVTRPRDGAVVCMLQFPSPSWYWDTVTKICVFLFAFVVPILIITVCYGLMLLRLRSVRLLSGSKEKDRSLRRITRMVLVVVGAFVVCWAPIHIFVIVWTLVDIDRRDPLVVAALHLCIALGYANSSLNPVLYAFLDENFKRCFRQLCRSPCGRPEPGGFSRARDTTARERVTACTPSDGPGGAPPPKPRPLRADPAATPGPEKGGRAGAEGRRGGAGAGLRAEGAVQGFGLDAGGGGGGVARLGEWGLWLWDRAAEWDLRGGRPQPWDNLGFQPEAALLAWDLKIRTQDPGGRGGGD